MESLRLDGSQGSGPLNTVWVLASCILPASGRRRRTLNARESSGRASGDGFKRSAVAILATTQDP